MTNQVAVLLAHCKPSPGKPLPKRTTSQGLPTPLKEASWRSALNNDSPGGFTLVELLVALGLGVLVAAWIMEALLAHGSLSAKLADRLHHREFEHRARRLIEDAGRRASRAPKRQPATWPVANRCCISSCPMANLRSPGAWGQRPPPSGGARC